MRYTDTENLGVTTNSIRAEVAAGSNMFARMFYKPKAQEAYALTTGEHSIFTYYLFQGSRGNAESVDVEV